MARIQGLSVATVTGCPLCGAPADWRRQLAAAPASQLQGGGWERRAVSTYNAVGEAVALGANYERRRPVREASLESDVAVPGLQALLSGLAAAVITGGVASWAAWPKPWTLALVAGGAGVALSWLALLRDSRNLLWEVETLLGADLDRDGSVGAPVKIAEPEARTVRVEVKSHGGKRIRFVDVPLSDGELTRLARATLRDGKTFSRRALTGVLEAEHYGELSAAMLKGGLLRYRGAGRKSGLELTGAGGAFLRQYLTGAA